MKKGFTLIELLAVIVILAFIALIATPIVLNIISDTKESASLRSADFYLDALELSIAQTTLKGQNITDGIYPIMRNGNLCLGTLNNGACTDELEVELSGETPKSGKVVITNDNIDSIYLEYNSNSISQNPKGELVSHNPICTYVDEDNNDTVNLSDIITCGTESFYVMSNENDVITMLSMYNLSSETNLQNETSYSNITFSTTNYWWDSMNSNVKSEYINGYVYGNIKDDNGIQQNIIYPYVEAYEKYLIKNGVNTQNVSLISRDQLENLGCFYDENCIDTTPNWVYSINYWTGDLIGTRELIYMDVIGISLFKSFTGTSGIRPVVTISTSEVK